MSIHILVCGALDGLCCCTVLQVECIRSDSFSKKNLIVLSVGVGHPSEQRSITTARFLGDEAPRKQSQPERQPENQSKGVIALYSIIITQLQEGYL